MFIFFFRATSTTEIYTLSLHDALPIFSRSGMAWITRSAIATFHMWLSWLIRGSLEHVGSDSEEDRKSTRLNSSHVRISYAVFCLKKKNKFHFFFSFLF